MSNENRDKQINEIVDRITKEWSERGMVMEGGWRVFLMVAMPKDASDMQKSEMRKAYYLGAQHLFASIMTLLDPGSEPTESDLKRMDAIMKELKRFDEEYQRAKN